MWEWVETRFDYLTILDLFFILETNNYKTVTFIVQNDFGD